MPHVIRDPRVRTLGEQTIRFQVFIIDRITGQRVTENRIEHNPYFHPEAAVLPTLQTHDAATGKPIRGQHRRAVNAIKSLLNSFRVVVHDFAVIHAVLTNELKYQTEAQKKLDLLIA